MAMLTSGEVELFSPNGDDDRGGDAEDGGDVGEER